MTAARSFDAPADPFSDAIRAAVRAEVEPIHSEITALRAEIAALRAALPPRLSTVHEAAEALGLSRATIRRRLADGTLQRVRVGGAVRVDLRDLQATKPPSDEKVARLAWDARHPGD